MAGGALFRIALQAAPQPAVVAGQKATGQRWDSEPSDVPPHLHLVAAVGARPVFRLAPHHDFFLQNGHGLLQSLCHCRRVCAVMRRLQWRQVPACRTTLPEPTFSRVFGVCLVVMMFSFLAYTDSAAAAEGSPHSVRVLSPYAHLVHLAIPTLADHPVPILTGHAASDAIKNLQRLHRSHHSGRYAVPLPQFLARLFVRPQHIQRRLLLHARPDEHSRLV